MMSPKQIPEILETNEMIVFHIICAPRISEWLKNIRFSPIINFRKKLFSFVSNSTGKKRGLVKEEIFSHIDSADW